MTEDLVIDVFTAKKIYRLEKALLKSMADLEANRKKLDEIAREAMELEVRLNINRVVTEQISIQDMNREKLETGQSYWGDCTCGARLLPGLRQLFLEAHRVLARFQGFKPHETGVRKIPYDEMTGWDKARYCNLRTGERNILRDLHDGPAQILFSILIRLELMSGHSHNELQEMNDEIVTIKELVRECLADLKHIMLDLKPPPFYQAGFIQVLQEYFRMYEGKFHFKVDFDFNGHNQALPSSIETALFRLIQEGLNNVRKHAGVNRARVRIDSSQDWVVLQVIDRGRGFDFHRVMEQDNRICGIKGMQERAGLLGGYLEIDSGSTAGTRVRIALPVRGRDFYEED